MKLLKYKSIIAQLVYFAVTIIFSILLFGGIFGSFQNLVNNVMSYSPTTIVAYITFAIATLVFGFPNQINTSQYGLVVSYLVYFVLHQILSYLIVNLITYLFTRKSFTKFLEEKLN